MTESIRNQYQPDAVTPPGATIEDWLDENSITQAALAIRMGVTAKFVNELVSGKATISPRTALSLEHALGVPAAFWLAREAQYREWLERTAQREALAADVGWLDELPIRYMRKFGWIGKSRGVDLVSDCLRFFGVASVSAWRDQYTQRPLAAFRKSANASTAIGGVATWLRQGELQAARINVLDFDRDRFLEALRYARSLTCEPDPAVFVPRLADSCARAGVAVTFVPEFPGCPISGATRWLSPRRALIQLSLRYKTNDHLWFTFFHESAHILKHGKSLVFLEGAHVADGRLEEDEADRHAADWLIPGRELARLRAQPKSSDAIQQFAQSIGIAPGIVVGRMQRERWIAWSQFNELKVRYRWADAP